LANVVKKILKKVLSCFVDKEFWYAILGALIGSGLAFWGGIKIFSIQTSRETAHEIEIKKINKINLLEGFKESIQGNIGLINDYLIPGRIDFVINDLNLSYLQSTAQIKYQVLNNIELSKQIDSLTHKLNSLEQAIKNYQSVYYNPLSVVGTNFLSTRGEELRKSIVQASLSILKDMNGVLKTIDEELKKSP